MLVIGDEAWPVPIPIVRTGDRWRFATEEGAEEIINRRVGGNERNAIYVLRAYSTRSVTTPRAIATATACSSTRRSCPARRASTTGCIGPTMLRRARRQARSDPWSRKAATIPGPRRGDPYRGYHFRILTRQGKNAPGGAYSYVINGRMIAGFAMVAYPAEYGESGVMTFIVNQNGKVYQKDLGKDSAAVGAKMTRFDPGAGWKEVAR